MIYSGEDHVEAHAFRKLSDGFTDCKCTIGRGGILAVNLLCVFNKLFFGFLRITAVLCRNVERMAADAGVTVDRLLADKELRRGIKPERYVDGQVGIPTVTDIVEALDKGGLDPREQLQAFSFDPNVRTIGDLREGMTLPGIVTNITAFGAFVDIGIKQDGLVHISQMADRYVASPAEVVHLGQQVKVRVTGIDTARGRISLSMRK